MARVKRAQIRKKRIKKLFKRSKGFFMSRNNTLRQANEAVMKARMNAYTVRKQKKRQYRAMWIARINAAARSLGISYSQLINSMTEKDILINRKILSDIAVNDPITFEKIAKSVIK